MNIEDLQKIASKLKGVTEDIKWENHLCFNVGSKMFIITSPDTVPVTASFKVDEEDFEELQQKEGFIAAPYLARYKWIKVDDISRFNKKEWEHHITQAYKIVGSKLSSKIKAAIGFEGA